MSILTNLPQLPLDVNDDALESNQQSSNLSTDALTDMSSAIHLFKLSRFNSEIKCVLYCVDRNFPPYTAPMITDIGSWKEDILGRLRQWNADIPRHPEGSPRSYVNTYCEIRYHELTQLILRPSPLFQQPSKESIRECFSSAMKCSDLYHKLYTTDKLHLSSISVHSLFLCVITIFYCVWTINGVAEEVALESLMRTLNSVSDILSATGEYWPEAKRSRDVLNRISVATTRRFTQNAGGTQGENRSQQSTNPLSATTTTTRTNVTPSSTISLEASSATHLNTNPGSEDLQQQPFGFESGNPDLTQSAPFFGNYYDQNSDQFVSLDMLSYFMGSTGDMNSNNAALEHDYFPSVEEVMQNGFGNGFGDGTMGFEQNDWL